MILIQRYVFKELFYNFLFSFAVISLVVLLATFLQVIFKHPELDLGMVVTSVPFMLLGIMSIVVPSASLVAVVTTYGRMAADNEILALSASGVHFFRIVVPGILFGILVSLLLLVANDRYVPRASQMIKSLGQAQEITPLLDNILKKGGKSFDRIPGWILTWESCEKTSDAGSGSREGGAWLFKNFRARRYDDDQILQQEYLAETATVETVGRSGREIQFTLHNFQVVVGGGSKASNMRLPKYKLPTDASKVRLEHRTLTALFAMLKKKHRSYKPVKIVTEIHSRIAQSLSPLIMIFLGLSVAVIFRYRNRMVAFFLSLMIAVFVYYPVMLLGKTFAEDKVLHPALCIWAGNVIMFLGGVWLLSTVNKR